VLWSGVVAVLHIGRKAVCGAYVVSESGCWQSGVTAELA